VSDWNQHLFLLLNASAHPAPWLVQAVILFAGSPVAVGPGVLAALWVWEAPFRRRGLLAVAVAMLAAQEVNQVLGLLVFEPRPFMVPVGHALMAHAPDNGFPSDHATFVWTLGAGLVLTGAARGWGVAVCLYGVGVAWSRVYLGVHFPDDMAASALVALACGDLARAVRPAVSAWLLPWPDRLYEAALPVLRLPPTLIPRQVRAERQFGMVPRGASATTLPDSEQRDGLV
jgi:undecaprenyl-diphosphatase